MAKGIRTRFAAVMLVILASACSSPPQRTPGVTTTRVAVQPAAESGPAWAASAQPLMLGARLLGTTEGGTSVFDGCSDIIHGQGKMPERIFRFDVESRQQVVVNLDAAYPRSRLALLGSDGGVFRCAKADQTLRETLEPGRYFVVVDGSALYGMPPGADHRDAWGAFAITATAIPLAAVADVCASAPSLTVGQSVAIRTPANAPSQFAYTCPEFGPQSNGESVHRLAVAERSRLRVTASGSSEAQLYVRSTCDAPSTQLSCSNGHALSTLVDPGDYFVYVDGPLGNGGVYELRVDLASPSGGTALGDVCAEAPLLKAGVVDLDTLEARDDYRGSCGGEGGPDVVRKIVVDRLTNLRVKVGPEMDARIYVRAQCDAPKSELACRSSLPGYTSLFMTLQPGTYFLFVDGSDGAAFGRAKLDVELEDVSAAASACLGAPVLPAGVTRGTLSKERRKMTYRMRLTQQQRVTLALAAAVAHDDMAVWFRRDSCVDMSAEVGRANESLEAGVLDAGTYFVTVMLREDADIDAAPFTLTSTMAPAP